MDCIVDLSCGSTELDFVTETSNLVIINPGQIVVTAIQVDSVETLPVSEPDDYKSIPSAESVFSCVERKDDFLYPFILLDEAMDVEFNLDMDKIKPSLARSQEILSEKGTLLKCVQALYVRASKNLSPKESANVR